MQEALLDERSLELMHLLQIAPRTPYAAAATILGVTPSALAARWRRLSAAGAAWITAYPSPRACGFLSAFVEIATANSDRDAVVARLVERRGRQRGGRGASPPDHGDRLHHRPAPAARPDTVGTRLLVEGRRGHDLGGDPGIRRRRHLAVGRPRRAPARRGRRPAYATPAPGGRVPAAAAARAVLTENADLVRALVDSPRASVADLSRACDAHPATVRRHLARLLRSGVLVLRCDMDHAAFGWPYSASWFARVDPRSLPRVAGALARLPQVRLVAGIQGHSNLVISVFSRTLEGLSRWEQQLAGDFPEFVLAESILHMRFHKRMGRLIDAHGRPTGELVPLMPPLRP